MCGCLSHAPHQRPGPQFRHVPWLGIEPVILWFASWRSIYWATPARAQFFQFLVPIHPLGICGLSHWNKFKWSDQNLSKVYMQIWGLTTSIAPSLLRSPPYFPASLLVLNSVLLPPPSSKAETVPWAAQWIGEHLWTKTINSKTTMV